MVALRRCDVLSVTILIMGPLAAVPLITGPLIAGLLTMALVITVPLITDLLITALLVPVLLITGLLTMAPSPVPLITDLLITALLVPVLLITGLLITAMLCSVVRSMGFAYDLPEVKTGIVRNFSPTFTSFESRDHFSEAVARGFGQ